MKLSREGFLAQAAAAMAGLGFLDAHVAARALDGDGTLALEQNPARAEYEHWAVHPVALVFDLRDDDRVLATGPGVCWSLMLQNPQPAVLLDLDAEGWLVPRYAPPAAVTLEDLERNVVSGPYAVAAPGAVLVPVGPLFRSDGLRVRVDGAARGVLSWLPEDR